MDSALLVAVVLFLAVLAWPIGALVVQIGDWIFVPTPGSTEKGKKEAVRCIVALRGGSLAGFILAGITLFSGLPRGITLVLFFLGAICWWLAHRLRRSQAPEN